LLFVEDGTTPGVRGFAGRKQITATEKALPARDGEGDYDSITALDLGDCFAGLLDDAHELVTENVTVMRHRTLAAVNM